MAMRFVRAVSMGRKIVAPGRKCKPRASGTHGHRLCGRRSQRLRSPVTPSREIMSTFTPHQDDALRAVAAWLKAKPGRNGTPQVFRLFGYAGTGKTTLARHIAEGVDGDVKYAAFTGKAALVMRNKGCEGA